MEYFDICVTNSACGLINCKCAQRSDLKLLKCNHFVVPVILCGGRGSRLWPRSRASRPKPFLPLIGEETLFTATIKRTSSEYGFAAPIVVAGEHHVDLIATQLGRATGATIIVEPNAMNTAAAIALAAFTLPGDAIMLVCPSDHHIAGNDAFLAAASAAAQLAAEGFLVSFGIEATWPATSYGYLERGEQLNYGGFKVSRFVEKPDSSAAANYWASGRFAWNGGIFAFRVSEFLAELETYAPDIAKAVFAAVSAGTKKGSHFYPAREHLKNFDPISVDYAIMEHTSRAAMVPASMGWSDIGSWDALNQVLERDPSGNSIQGKAELVDCRNVFVSSDGPRVSVIGIKDAIIVVDGDEVLVTSRTDVQRVGKLKGALNQ